MDSYSSCCVMFPTLKRKSSSSVMDGLQGRKEHIYIYTLNFNLIGCIQPFVPPVGGEVPEGRPQLVDGERVHVGTKGGDCLLSGCSEQDGGREGLQAVGHKHSTP